MAEELKPVAWRYKFRPGYEHLSRGSNSWVLANQDPQESRVSAWRDLRSIEPLYTRTDPRDAEIAELVADEGAILTIRVSVTHRPGELNTVQTSTTTHLKTGPNANPVLVWDAIQQAIAHENAAFSKCHPQDAALSKHKEKHSAD